MKRHFVSLLLLSMLLALSMTGCGRGLSDFTFSYTMESVDNYKLTLTVGDDRSYRLETVNYYMDKHAGKLAPKVTEGTLTGTEFNAFSRLLGETDFFGMKDSYGFEEEAPDMDIMYQIYFETGGKDKYISIRNSAANKFPTPFLQLLKYINGFLASKNK